MRARYSGMTMQSMIPLLRLFGMMSPILGAVAFCFLASVIRSFTDHPPASLGVAVLAFIAVGSNCLDVPLRPVREKDRRIRDFLFVVLPGPREIRLTRTPQGVRLRIPDEYPQADVPKDIGGFMFGLLFLGSVALLAFMLHNGSHTVPPAPTELHDPTSFLLACPLSP